MLASPKRHVAALPADLCSRQVVDPVPVWCWSLITRADDDREAVEALRRQAHQRFAAAAGRDLPPGGFWVPGADPHRGALLAAS